MRLFLYYASHSFINQIRKLLKTWVAVFILVCFVFGAAVGLGFGFAADRMEGETEVSAEEEPLNEEDLPALVITDENRADVLQYFELGLSVLMLGLIVWELFSAEKSGGKIFLMADVNLLFSAPLKPQSVLIFRLINQLGAIFLGFLYLLFQLPNLVLNVGIPLESALMMIGLLILMISYAKLLNVFVYTLSSTHPNWKRRISPFIYGGITLLLAAFVVYWKISGKSVFPAVLAFFNGAYSRYIPIWGWFKLALAASFNGQWMTVFGIVALLIGCIPLISWLIWRLKADFYEDAMIRSAEAAEKQQKAREGKTLFNVSRKTRKDSLIREGFRRGSGAGVYLTKALYNRFRCYFLHFFTKTSFTYLFISAALGVFLRVAFQIYDYSILGLVLAGACFFRALGNPIHEDLTVDSFIMIPEKHGKKILYSTLGGTVNCTLDLIPACILGAILLPAHWYWALLLLLLGVSLDFYSAAAGVFIDLSLPVSAPKTVKTLIQIVFIYFGLGPDAILIVLGFFISMPVMLSCAVAFNLLLGGILLLISPVFLESGRK